MFGLAISTNRQTARLNQTRSAESLGRQERHRLQRTHIPTESLQKCWIRHKSTLRHLSFIQATLRRKPCCAKGVTHVFVSHACMNRFHQLVHKRPVVCFCFLAPKKSQKIPSRPTFRRNKQLRQSKAKAAEYDGAPYSHQPHPSNPSSCQIKPE